MDENKPSFSGPNPTLTELEIKVPHMKDQWDNWQYYTVKLKNIPVQKVTWGPTLSTYTPQDGCYEGMGFQDINQLKRPNFTTVDKDQWSVPSWEFNLW